MYFVAAGDLCPGASIAAKGPRSQPVSLLEPLLKRLHHCESSLCPFQVCTNLLQLRSVFLKGLRTIPLNCKSVPPGPTPSHCPHPCQFHLRSISSHSPFKTQSPLHSWGWSSVLSPLFSQFSCSVISNSLQHHGLQHARPPCPSPTPGVYSNSCPLSR